MKTTFIPILTIAALIILATSATPSFAAPRAEEDFNCREVQREVQVAVADATDGFQDGMAIWQRLDQRTGPRGHKHTGQWDNSETSHRGGDRGHQRRRWYGDGSHHRVVAALRVLREYKRHHVVSGRCSACILREFVRDVPIGDQSPCGPHDVCVTGARLRHNDDECVADVCARSPFCCFGWWTKRCVSAAERTCEFRCDVCAHDACIDGVALPSDCDECTTQVCATDPYCCDTAWDDRCVARADDECSDWCAPVTTTSTTSTTTSTTSTSTTSTTSTTTLAPVLPLAPTGCTTDSECEDGNVCTNDFCEADGSCSHRNNRAPCEDGNPCTLNDGCSFGTCRGGVRMNCDDSDACTFDWCHTSGECRHRAISCNDADRCTVDTCDPAVGCGYTPTDCDDGDRCTIDDCHRSLGCVNTRAAECPLP